MSVICGGGWFYHLLFSAFLHLVMHLRDRDYEIDHILL